MSFRDLLRGHSNYDWDSLFEKRPKGAIDRAINSDNLSIDQFAMLLSTSAEDLLEDMACRSHELTLRHFGRTIQLYTPLYLSNYCDNTCLYCGFNSIHDIERKRLSLKEVKTEAAFIVSTGLKHVLILTGESRNQSPVGYIKECVRALRDFFSSISIEVYALTQKEYAELITEGVDALTLYQETYNPAIYEMMHPSGPKRDYGFRLEAPERAAVSGMRSVTIGALFGLDDWRRETFLMGLHASYLLETFPEIEIGASLPRIRPTGGNFKALHRMTDKNMVQAITALRVFLPRLSLTLSTREDASFRENLIPLGITKMSAGSTTRVGGHTTAASQKSDTCQFEISDERSVGQIRQMLSSKGYQPVLKDWMQV